MFDLHHPPADALDARAGLPLREERELDDNEPILTPAQHAAYEAREELALELGRALLRLVPDATAERVEGLVSTGLAVERLDATGEYWQAQYRPTTTPGYLVAIWRDEGGVQRTGATLTSAVAAALGETNG